MSLRSFILSIIVLLVCIVLPAFLKKTAPLKKQISRLQHIPDAKMNSLVSLVFDLHGVLKLKIVAPQMLHFATNNTTQLFSPIFTIYRNSLHPWIITAKQAFSYNGIKRIQLKNNVHIYHATDRVSPETTIKTDALTLYPDQNLAITHEMIVLTQPKLHLQAKGMIADLKTGHIRLLTHTQGNYVFTTR